MDAVTPTSDIWDDIMLAGFGAIWPLASSCMRLHLRVLALKATLIEQHRIVSSESDPALEIIRSRLPNGRYFGVTSLITRFSETHIEYYDNVVTTAVGFSNNTTNMEYANGVTCRALDQSDPTAFEITLSFNDGNIYADDFIQICTNFEDGFWHVWSDDFHISFPDVVADFDGYLVWWDTHGANVVYSLQARNPNMTPTTPRLYMSNADELVDPPPGIHNVRLFDESPDDPDSFEDIMD